MKGVFINIHNCRFLESSRIAEFVDVWFKEFFKMALEMEIRQSQALKIQCAVRADAWDD